MELFDAVKARHSYRGMYQTVPVSRNDLQAIMTAGLAAPSGCNRQTTSLIALDDPALIKQVSGLLNKPNFASAPAAVCVLTEPIPAIGGRFYNVQDYAAAIENILLAVTALGYASCWVEGYVTGSDHVGDQMAALLGVPQPKKLVAYLPIGVPAEQITLPPKKPDDERCWFNGYGN